MSNDQNAGPDFSGLAASDSARHYTGSALGEISFPLGGIGTGTIALGGRGNLGDCEVENKSGNGRVMPQMFFALWVKRAFREPVAKVLEGRIPPPYRSSFGSPGELAGLPRFANAEFTGEYPAAKLILSDPDMPVGVSLKAWNPFIPLNVYDSALPVAIFEWTFTNLTTARIELSMAASVYNPLYARADDGKRTSSGMENVFKSDGDLSGIFLHNTAADMAGLETSSLSLVSWNKGVVAQTAWYQGRWKDSVHLFWDRFSLDGGLCDVTPDPIDSDVCILTLRAALVPGESVTLPVGLTWHFPMMTNPWPATGDNSHAVLKTYVGAHFNDAWDVARYVAGNIDRLKAQTQMWHDAMFSGSIPTNVVDAVTSEVSNMRSPTFFLLEDGSLHSWSNCCENECCCQGDCKQLLSYEQSLAFLFPQLERSMRVSEFLHNIRDTGGMVVRSHLPAGSGQINLKPCADGQMAAVMQVYRDWKLSGDDEFLRLLWPQVRSALEYAWKMTPYRIAQRLDGANPKIDSPWDSDRDGVMEGVQHNTYNTELYGPNTLCTGLYLGALRACEELASYLGELEVASQYKALFESGQSKVGETLWNGKYYVQKVQDIDSHAVPSYPDSLSIEDGEVGDSPVNSVEGGGGGCAVDSARDNGMLSPKYQYGDGCLSDQLIGQWMAHVMGLGYILDQEHVRTAVKSIYDYNFRRSLDGHSNVQRTYALNEEAGLLVCSWPHGNRPVMPFVYSDEVWTCTEYQVAAHLIYEGFVQEGLEIIKAARDRHAGWNRNPWHEVECGHNCARAMSSWSVKLALDGFRFDLVKGILGFAPKVNREDCRTFWSTSTGWGLYEQSLTDSCYRLTVLYGSQKIIGLELADLLVGVCSAATNSGAINVRAERGMVWFDSIIGLAAGEWIEVCVTHASGDV